MIKVLPALHGKLCSIHFTYVCFMCIQPSLFFCLFFICLGIKIIGVNKPLS